MFIAYEYDDHLTEVITYVIKDSIGFNNCSSCATMILRDHVICSAHCVSIVCIRVCANTKLASPPTRSRSRHSSYVLMFCNIAHDHYK